MNFQVLKNLSTNPRNLVLLINIKDKKYILKKDNRIESTILEKLNGNNYPKLFKRIKTNKTSFLIEDYIDGISLSRFIKENGPLDYSKIQEIAFKCYLCIKNLRKNNIIHKDIKPSHFILSSTNQEIFLIDFDNSLIKSFEEPFEIDLFGTKGYTAPERYQKELYFESDLFSLGAVIYFLATGKHPPEVNNKRKFIYFKYLISKISSKSIRQLINKLTYYNPKKRIFSLNNN